ncbi:Lrp/AsnC family transcriptional regulator [Streptoalloteichus hindustanus]|uniref:Lrp/AsnC family transcriptional regulator n=1 Tax=Streptoalloteichus hindustanus TaxID=2017 RepID=UPI000935FB85|nr:Lrp/AsnC family transcriptional regulator [Streptoalloteichus hindustanus]
MPRDGKVLDELDHRLLALLQEDSGRTLGDLGEAVGLSASAVQRRVERYRASGILARCVAVLEPRHGLDVLLAVCLVTLERESSHAHEEFRSRLLAAPEVQQLYNVAGDTDYVVVLATTGMAHHREVADRLLKDSPNVLRYSTMFVLDPVRTGSVLPTRHAKEC